MLFSIFKKISFVLIVTLIISPIFFLQSKIIYAKQEENPFDESNLINTKRKLSSFFSNQYQPANVFTGFVNALSQKVYCGISELFSNSCEVQGTTTVVTNTINKNPTTIVTENNTQVVVNGTQNPPMRTIVQRSIERVVNPVGNTIITGITEAYLNNRLTELATQLRSEMKIPAVVYRSSNSSNDISARQIDHIYESMSDNIDDAIEGLTIPNLSGGTEGYVLQATTGGFEWVATSTLGISGGSSFSTSSVRQAISESVLGMDYNSTTGDFSLTSGYSIPLTASTTDWSTAFGWGNHATQGYLTSYTETDPFFMTASSTFSLKANNLSDLTSTSTARTNLGLGSLSLLNTINNSNWSGTALSIANGGTGTTTAPAFGQLLMGNGSGGYNLVATSSLGIELNLNTLNPVRVGNGNIVSSTFSSAFGNSNTASGYKSSAAGYDNTASASGSSAFGYVNTASGIHSSAFGDQNIASANNASAFGFSNNVTVSGSTAVGYDNTVNAGNASAFGSSITNAIANSTMIGPSNSAKVTILDTGELKAQFINATSTTATSTFNGAVDVKSTLLANGSAGTTGYILQTTGTGVQWVATSTLGFGAGESFSTSTTRSVLSSSATGLTYNSTTGDFSLTSGYSIPLTASTTDWSTAFGWGNHATQGYLTSYTETDPFFMTASSTFSLKANNLSDLTSSSTARTNLGLGSLSLLNTINNSNWSGTALSIANGGTGTTTAPAFGQLLMGNGSGGYNLVATSSLGIGSNINALTSIQVGNSNTAGGSSSGLGYSNEATGAGSTAAGYQNAAAGFMASAMGANNTASSYRSVAMGFSNTASTGNYNVAVGALNTVSGSQAAAFGRGNNVSGADASAFGLNITNAIANSLMIGPSNSAKVTILSTGELKAQFINATSTTATSTFNGAVDVKSTLLANGSAGTTGYILQTTGTGVQWVATSSLGIGGSVNLNALSPVQVGNGNTASSTQNASAFGYSNTASGLESVSIGHTNSATGMRSAAVGLANIASGDFSSAYGRSNNVTGAIAVAFGHGNTLSATRAAALGVGNTVSGNYSTVSGYQSSATARYANILGYSNNISQEYGTAIGYDNTVSGLNGSAVGYLNTVSASGASAFGSSIINAIANSTMIGPSNSAKVTILSTGELQANFITSTSSATSTFNGPLNVKSSLLANGSAGTTGYILQTTGTGVQWVATSSLGISGGGGSSQWITNASDIYYSTGNVGIGTTTPGSALTVASNGLFGGTLSVLSTGTSTFAGNILIGGNITPTVDNTQSLGTLDKQWRDVFIGPGSLYVNGQKVLEEDGSNNIVVSADINQTLALKTSGTGDVELNPTGTGLIYMKGNVEVSGGKVFSTSDNSVLSFTDGILADHIQILGNEISATNLNGGISLTPSGIGGVYVTSGNLGVGTTTPGSKLTVAGDFDFSGALKVNGSAGTAGYVLQTTGTSTQWVATSTLGIGGGSSQWATNGSNISYIAGNVSIGTTTSDSKLLVNGTTDTKQLVVRANSTQTSNLTEWQDAAGTLIARISSSLMPFEVFSTVAGVSANLIPTMTSNTAPSGTASASSILNSSYDSWYAFAYNLPNGNTQTWVSSTNSGWLRYQFPTARTIVRYKITNRNEANPRAPENWTFEGSNDGTNWTVLDTQSNSSWLNVPGTALTINISNTNAYTYYRVNISTKPSDSYVGIGRLEMYEASGTAAASAFAVNPSGYVGIGTTTSSSKLAVVGDIDFSGALKVNGSAGTAGYVLQTTGTSTQWVATSTLGISGGSGSTNVNALTQIAVGNLNATSTLGTNASAFGYSNIASGLGASSFGYANTASGSNASVFGYASTASQNKASAFGANNTASGSYSVAVGFNNNASGSQSAAVGYNNVTSVSNASAFGSGITNSITNSTMVGPSNTAKITILSTGNLGVGTTTPGSKLTVAGDIDLTGTLKVNGLAGTNGYTLQSTGSGLQWAATGSTIDINGQNPISFGNGNATSTLGSTASAFGYQNTASNTAAVSLGFKNAAGALNAVAVGNQNFIAVGGHSAITFGLLNNQTGASVNTISGIISGTGIATTTGVLSTAVGHLNNAQGTQSSAFGFDNTVFGARSVASGYLNTASGSDSATFGNVNTASGPTAMSFGYNNNATSTNSMAFGYANTSGGISASAFGYSNIAQDTYSSAFGHDNLASALRASAFGYQSTASAVSSSAFGYINVVSGASSSAFGYQNTVTGGSSSAFGSSNTLSGTGSIAGNSNTLGSTGATVTLLGNNNSGYGTQGSAVGFNNITRDSSSSAFGNSNNASSTRASAFGYNNTVTNGYSSAFGYSNTVSGAGSTIFGYGSTVSGSNSSAFGHQNTVTGSSVAVFGHSNSTVAGSGFIAGNSNLLDAAATTISLVGISNQGYGNQGSAVGYNNTTRDTSSSAFGNANFASSSRASAFGYGNTANAIYSSAFGYINSATGNYASVFGYGSTASGANSSVFGYQNTAASSSSSVFGQGITNTIDNSTMIGPSNTAKMTILSDGSVGVGTTTPYAKMHIVAENGTPEHGLFIDGDYDATDLLFRIRSNINAASFVDTDTKFLVTGAGNVGIGTSTPNSKLTLAGDIDVAGGTLKVNGVAGTNGYILASTGTGLQWIANAGNVNDYSTIAFGKNNATTTAGVNASMFGYQNTASTTNASAFGYLNIASGVSASAFGYNNTVSGSGSSVFGYQSVATNTDSIALGYKNISGAQKSTVVGYQNFTTGGNTTSAANFAVAIGFLNNAVGYTNTNSYYGTFTGTPVATSTGRGSSAIGLMNISAGVESQAFGILNNTYGASSVAFGGSNTTRGSNAIALGISNIADNSNSIAFGRSNNSLGNQSMAFGYENNATSSYSSAFGYGNISGTQYSTLFGVRNYTGMTGGAAIAVGILNNQTGGTTYSSYGFGQVSGVSVATTTGINSMAFGIENIIPAYRGLGVGYSNYISANYGSAVGYDNNVIGSETFAFGLRNTSSGSASQSFGKDNITSSTSTEASAFGNANFASGYRSMSFGLLNNAHTRESVLFGNQNFTGNTGGASVAIGILNNQTGGFTSSSYGNGFTGGTAVATTTGIGSVAVGVENIAGAFRSQVFGYSNIASANYASAFGFDNTVSGDSALVFGYGSTASGARSNVFGYNNIASGAQALVFGYGSTASTTDSIAIGRGVLNGIATSLMIGPSDAAKVTILSSGNLGVGTTTPGQKLSVVGSAQFTGVGSGAYAFDLNLTSDGILTTSASDRRLKENIQILDASSTLEKLIMLEPSSFDWKSNGAHDIGLIAQDVELVFPELVFTNKTDGFKGINYSRLPALLLSGVQEIFHRVEDLANIVETKLLKADKVETKELCLDDLCITKDQLQQILDGSNSPVTPPPTVTPDSNPPVVDPDPVDDTPPVPIVPETPPTDPVIPVEPEPAPTPAPESEPVPEPEPAPVEPTPPTTPVEPAV